MSVKYKAALAITKTPMSEPPPGNWNVFDKVDGVNYWCDMYLFRSVDDGVSYAQICPISKDVYFISSNGLELDKGNLRLMDVEGGGFVCQVVGPYGHFH